MRDISAVAPHHPGRRPVGRSVMDLLLGYRPDAAWKRELGALRSMLVTEERDWND